MASTHNSNKESIAIIDGYGFVFRAYHALPPLTRADGTNVGAVSGFTNMLIKLLASLKVSHIAIVFDSGSKTFRNDIYPAYKANRPECPADLIPQFAIVREAAEALNLAILEKVGFEADDIIATLAKKAAGEDFNVIIVSSDKDLMQLVTDNICMFDAMKNKTITATEVEEKFFVPPSQVLDVLSLMGDASDNVPGVRGIGPKTAAELIKEFGNLENLLENISNIKSEKRREMLSSNIDNALLSKKLISLQDKMELGITFDDLKVQTIEPNKLITFLRAQGFRALILRVEKEFADVLNGDSSPNKQAIYEPFSHSAIAAEGLPPVNQGFRENKGVNKSFKEITKIIVNSVEIAEKIWAQALIEGAATIDYFGDCENLQLITISTAKNSGSPTEVYYFEFDKIANEVAEEKPQPALDLFGFNLEIAKPIAVEKSTNFSNVDFLKLLLKIATSNAITKIFFSSKELIKFLQLHHKTDLEAFEDASLINHLLNSSIKNNLRELIDINLDLDIESNGFGEIFAKLEKSNIVEIFNTTEQRVDFFCFKNYAIGQLFNILKAGITAQSLHQTYLSFEKPLLKVLAKMELVGIKVDVSKLKELSQEFAQEIQVLSKEIYALAGEEFNIASTKQLGEVLFGKLGLTSSKKSKKTGADSTKSSVLEELALDGNVIADKILEFRHFSKLKNTYTDALPTQVSSRTGRVHTHFSNITTLTGRLSSYNPNLQNIPIKSIHGRKIRQAFVAKEGYLLISADYSQIELRVLAHIANIESLKLAFRQNKDIHAITASEIFGVKEEEVSQDLRSKAKAINFGIIYGISAFGLARQLKISRKEAGIYIKAYLEKYPGIENYMKQCIEFAKENEFVQTIGGRKCFIRDINGKNPILKSEAERQAINAPIQGSAADIMKKAMINLDKKLTQYCLQTGVEVPILLQIHDELIIEAPEEKAEEIAALVKLTMEKAFALDVLLKVDVEIASSWK